MDHHCACGNTIELKFSKDRETGMHENYWWCDSCNKRTEPMKLGVFFSYSSITHEQLKKFKEQWYEQLNKSMGIDPGLGKFPRGFSVERKKATPATGTIKVDQIHDSYIFELPTGVSLNPEAIEEAKELSGINIEEKHTFRRAGESIVIDSLTDKSDK